MQSSVLNLALLVLSVTTCTIWHYLYYLTLLVISGTTCTIWHYLYYLTLLVISGTTCTIWHYLYYLLSSKELNNTYIKLFLRKYFCDMFSVNYILKEEYAVRKDEENLK
jgi:hypothetical protein